MLETASPPTFYIPAADLSQELTPLEVVRSASGRVCFIFFVRRCQLAWRYDNPSDRFRAIDGAYSFMPLAECWVDGESPSPGR